MTQADQDPDYARQKKVLLHPPSLYHYFIYIYVVRITLCYATTHILLPNYPPTSQVRADFAKMSREERLSYRFQAMVSPSMSLFSVLGGVYTLILPLQLPQMLILL